MKEKIFVKVTASYFYSSFLEIQNVILKYNFSLLLRSDKKLSHVNCLCSRPFLHTALGYQPETPKIASLWTKLATKLLTSRKINKKTMVQLFTDCLSSLW